MILMIDNYDSFTYNIVQYCLELGADLKVIKNDELTLEEIKALSPEKVIISPGPATPNESGVSLDVIKEFSNTNIPILGICLGHQSIAQVFGAEIIKADTIMHGKTSQIEVLYDDILYKNLPSQMTQTRYHSLTINKQNLPDTIIVTSKSLDDDEIMSLKIKDKNMYGVQFHPESIMSEYGHEILNNFLKV
ncbi:MAG: aminodeoxychorismate/anthranilate synthase component II [Arcobacter sp.]|nr:MAG: aminodeoxychorismate/anthranilate synthase component II [Arcobacter sp.]